MENAFQKRWLAAVYAVVIFASAFLLFQIQPMISKAILPWFGGTSAVWTTCLLFFQSLLFGGYAYAHFSNTSLRPKFQAVVHVALIAAAVVFLHVLPNASAEPQGGGDPTREILVMLALTIGLPYFVLSATGPLLQAWFARSFPERTPYRLYALSNIGSLLALVSYPFVFERFFELPQQAILWSIGFIAFAVLCGATAACSSADDNATESSNLQSSTIADANMSAGAVDRIAASPLLANGFLWLLFPAFASATLMATTNHISTDVAVVPLLWIIPLALYLLTFIIAFDRSVWYRRTLVAALTIPAIYATGLAYKEGIGAADLFKCGFSGKCLQSAAEMLHLATVAKDGSVTSPEFHIGFRTALAANFAAMFGICFLCHGELARLKPPTRYLTAYYLLMSAGGALGGLAVSVVAPHVFATIFEWKLTVFAGVILAIGIVLYALVNRVVPGENSESGRSTLMSRITLVVLLIPTSFVLLDLTDYLYAPRKNVVFQSRNFFGTLAIRKQDADNPRAENLVLLNGTTIHGSQFTSPERRGQPTSYYATTSAVGRVLNFFHANRPPGGVRIGDVGLGTGTLAAYAGKGDYLTFFEINPAVVEMSTSGEWFTYVTDCRARGAHCDIKLGDARLTLEREVHMPKLPRYHVLVLDAFSGDAVPTHLLTAEAYDIYLPRLATEAVDGADGALIVHVSNRYLDLARVVRAAAERIKFDCLEIHSPGVDEQLINSADWMVLTRNRDLLSALNKFAYKPDTPPKLPVLWTDAHSSLFEIVR